MSRLDAEQAQAALELMPDIIKALRAADDAARGYGWDVTTKPPRRYDVTPEQGLQAIREAAVGDLLDQLGNWCWCPKLHEGDCP